ncbi:MAG: GntR family transcriptional regulator [Erysipelotrichaceae bacterium]|nr:GntR family transcriptional regulator [Erysipelotrichaceae bacterium]
MRIIIHNSSMVPIYEQVVNQIKAQIISGELKDGDILPSVRNMAAELRISSLTVKKAYDFLEEEGLVTTVHGKGTFVNAADSQMAAEARRKAIEDDLSLVISKAFTVGLSEEELKEIFEIILEDYDDTDKRTEKEV